MEKSFKYIKYFLEKNNISFKTNIEDNETFLGLCSLINSKKEMITFCEKDSFKELLSETNAKACIIKPIFKKYISKNFKYIEVDKPYVTFALLSNFFYLNNINDNKISKNSFVHNTSKLYTNVGIGEYVVIKNNCNIEDNVIINNNTSIGPNVSIKKNTIIFPNCSISNTNIGENCLIQSGCVIGDRGFGFTLNEKVDIIHIGNVIIGDNVQIGSNTTIDKAAIDSTTIGDNVRIDNLVQIAHGVSIGDNSVIAAQVGIAGSSQIGSNCVIGGQAGISGHLKIGNNVMIAAKSGVTKNVKDNSIIAGFPAVDIKKWKKNVIKFNKS